MSVRRVLRFTLMAVLAAVFAPPAAADEPVPVAPMPRAKKEGRIEIELRFGAPHGIELRLQSDAARQPSTAQAPCCGKEGCCKPAAAPKTRVRDFYGVYPGGVAVEEAWQPVPACPAPPRLIAGGCGPCPAPIPGVVVPPMMACAPPVAWNPVPAPWPVTRVIAVKAVEASQPNPLLGTWKRDLGLMTFNVTFTPDEMKLCITQGDGGESMTCTITAHYTLTKDGLVHGAITGADIELESQQGDKSKLLSNRAEMALAVQQLADQPFAFRVKSTSAGLMVSQVKTAGFDGFSAKELAILGGLYKRDESRAPMVTFTQTRCEAGIGAILGAACGKPVAGACIGGLVGSACDKPTPCAPPVLGFDFAPAPVMPPSTPPAVCPGPLPVMAPPMLPAPPCPMPQPVRPVAGSIPNDSMKQMAVEAFGEMMWERGVTRPIGGMTLPSPQYLEHYPQYFAPDPCILLPRDSGCPESSKCGAYPVTPPARPSIVGTWYRDFGTKRCVVTVAAGHMTLAVSETDERDGKPVTAHMILTADYHLARDEMTAVGLLTNVDLKFEGDLPADEMREFAEKLTEIQKEMEDKPFAMTCRVYGDALVIGNVRMPSLGHRMGTEPASYFGGRYTTAGDKPVPKLKSVTASTKAMPRCTTGDCVPPTPVGPVLVLPTGPSALDVPLGPPLQEVPPPALPGTPVLPASGTVPVMPEPTAPVPSMTTPVAPGVGIAVPALGPIGLVLDFDLPLNTAPGDNRQLFNFSVGLFGSDAPPEPVKPIPMMPEPVKPELLRSTDDLREIQNEWRRFWFNDLPSHLTPERIHGGIY
jgi:hypothetical protein